jgi:hypothetical protein
MSEVKTLHFNFLRISQSSAVDYDGGQMHWIVIPSYSVLKYKCFIIYGSFNDTKVLLRIYGIEINLLK